MRHGEGEEGGMAAEGAWDSLALLHVRGWKEPVKQSCPDLLQERKRN